MLNKKEITEKILEEIRKVGLADIPVIVEGKKDKKSLQELGLSNIITLNKPLFVVIESVDSQRIIILTDLDAEGLKLYNTLKSGLVSRGVIVDDKLRKLILRSKVRYIESLSGFIAKWKLVKE